MAPHLKPEVIAAIEAAVECNEGSLESAYIHSLAKIYKTSPQAIVWNMKRYNKVKAGMDDRQKTGRHAVMDKDAAAEFTKEMLKETPGLRMDKISEKLFEKFGVHVSMTWVSRLVKNYDIVYKEPKPPKIKKVRIPKPPKPTRQPVGEEPNPSFTPQDSLPPPGQYPAFRQDLKQAIAAPPSAIPSISPGGEGGPIPDVYFGILKPKRSLPPPQLQRAPAEPYIYPDYPPPYQYRPATYPPHMRFAPSSMEPPMPPREPPNPSAPVTKQPDTVWKVMNVVELD
jgi:transposase